jgi:outer membrane lipopolysaccharide assembly protein LptE/RlpB
MIKIMKKIISLCLFFLVLQGCGYTPIYSKNQKINYYIEDISFNDADPDLAFFIKDNLRNYLIKKNNQKFRIAVIVNYSKTPISKNSAGEADEYQLSSIIEFIISSEKKEKKLEVKETIKIKNLENEFEEKNYEKNAKKNMARSSTSKLLMQLSRFDDN